MLVGTSLNSIGFLSSSDSTRLQMSAKQLLQTVTCLNTRVPYVIGKDWKYLSHTSKYFKQIAPSDGEIIYSNEDLLVALLLDEQGEAKLEVYNTPKYLETANSFATQLRYRRDHGSFSKNDIIYEYCSFFNGVPCYGYNAKTMFFPFFGYNFEDSIVISESIAQKAKALKFKKIYIYVYYNSIYKFIYPESKYQFIPEVGQKIHGNIIVTQISNKNTIQNVNLYNYNELIGNDDVELSANSVLCKMEDAEVVNIKIHRVNKSRGKKLIDRKLDEVINRLVEDYACKLKRYSEEFKEYIGPLSTHLLASNYIMINFTNIGNSLDDLAYIVELELGKEYETQLGDKFANRYANKGVTNLILPDELRPINMNTHEPIDVIKGTMGIYSRMNFGQICEAVVSKAVAKVEKEILFDVETLGPNLSKLSRLAQQLGDNHYSDEINSLVSNLDTIKHDFINSVSDGGLYFEVPSFTNINIKKLKSFIENEFNVQISEPIKIPKETFKYIKQKSKINIPLPDKDLIYPKIFTSSVYLLKLMQLSESKLSARDFGQYKTTTRQPAKDRTGIGTGSRLGSMEMDALLAHDIPQVISEMRTVKSDCLSLKKDLVNKILHDGMYTIPQSERNSYTKIIIDTLITYLNN